MDIRAKHAGAFVGGTIEAGGEVLVGAALYKIDTGAAGTAAAPAAPAPATKAPVETTAPAPATSGTRREVTVPTMGESITQGVLAEWVVKAGTVVNADDILARIDTDKVSPLNSPA
jgi:pyruvate/2-oxoglutarate dehydrogenase complex dihydrolipoamide acyltransferase (E2) component